MVGQHRSTQRHNGKVVSIEEAKLRPRLREIAAEHIRWGRCMTMTTHSHKAWTITGPRQIHGLLQLLLIERPPLGAANTPSIRQ